MEVCLHDRAAGRGGVLVEVFEFLGLLLGAVKQARVRREELRRRTCEVRRKERKEEKAREGSRKKEKRSEKKKNELVAGSFILI